MDPANFECAIFLILCPILERRINHSLLRDSLWKEDEVGLFKGERIWVRIHKIMG
jgi:hypothetical protein